MMFKHKFTGFAAALAVLLFSILSSASFSVKAYAYDETYSPKQYRWNFQSNEIMGLYYDRVFMGEKVQPFVSGDSLSYGNVWRVDPNDIGTIDTNTDEAKLNLWTGCALRVEPYYWTNIDLNTINDRITSTWSDKLFSDREKAILNTGTEKTGLRHLMLINLEPQLMETMNISKLISGIIRVKKHTMLVITD